MSNEPTGADYRAAVDAAFGERCDYVMQLVKAGIHERAQALTANRNRRYPNICDVCGGPVRYGIDECGDTVLVSPASDSACAPGEEVPDA